MCDAATGEPVALQQLARQPDDLRRLIEVDPLCSELGRKEAKKTRARADVGDGGLTGRDQPLKGSMKSGVAHAIGEQSAVVLDAHGNRQSRERPLAGTLVAQRLSSHHPQSALPMPNAS